MKDGFFNRFQVRNLGEKVPSRAGQLKQKLMKTINVGKKEWGGRIYLASPAYLGAILFLVSLSAILTVNIQAQTTLSGDHVITGDLDVGTSGTTGDLRVTGTTVLSGKVGVGTSSPAAQAHISTGTASAKGLVIQGAASQSANLQEWQSNSGAGFASINSAGNFTLNSTPDSNVRLFVRQSLASSGATYYAGRFENDSATAAIDRSVGIYASAFGYNNTTGHAMGVEARGYGVGVSGTLPVLYGATSGAYHLGGGLIINNMYGIQATSKFYSSTNTGHIWNAYGAKIYAGGSLAGGQTISDAYGVHVDVGATTNAYGIFVNPFNTSPSGNSYGVYVNGGSNNYFAGNVGIGTSVPSYKLHVVGNLNFTGTLFQNGTLFTSGAGWAASGSNAVFGSGKVGIGTNAPNAKQEILSTTEQLRVGYSGSTYYSTTVGSAGAVQFNAVGSSAYFEFSDSVHITGFLGVNGNVSLGAYDAFGSDSVALSRGSVFGNFATAMGGGYAEGDGATAISGGVALANYSIAAGRYTNAVAAQSFVIGRHNVIAGTENLVNWVESDPLFVVGNGTGESEDPPEIRNRDAFIVYKDGTIRIAKRQGDILMGDFGNPE